MFNKRTEQKLAAFQNEYMQKYYDEVENMYAKMRAWRHDYRHHIQAMKVHMANGEYTEAEAYLDMLDNDLTNVETVIKTGNRMADAILNSKLSLAAQRKITVRAEAKIPVSLTVPELDLCIILGNLLDNAIEACMGLPEEKRLIRVYMEMKGSYLYMAVSNTAAGGKKQKRDGRFSSTKGVGHGMGLLRIDGIIEKYGGYLTRASEEEAFTTEVLLPQ